MQQPTNRGARPTAGPSDLDLLVSPIGRDSRLIQLTSVLPAGDAPPRSATSVSAAHGHPPMTGYRVVHCKSRSTRNRKERSVDFNLMLDVHQLQQQIQQLTTTRYLLQSRILYYRHLPTVSFMLIVRKLFQLFRWGFRVEQQYPEQQRRHVITAMIQREFLDSVADHDIDFGQ